MTELTEINHVKYLVNGEVNSDFSDTYVRKQFFRNIFIIYSFKQVDLKRSYNIDF